MVQSYVVVSLGPEKGDIIGPFSHINNIETFKPNLIHTGNMFPNALIAMNVYNKRTPEE